MTMMINPTAAKQALKVLASGSYALREATLPVRDALSRMPHYDHCIELEPSNNFTFDNGMVCPCREDTIWLHEEQRKGHIGLWDSCLGHDDKLIVSFEREEDAVLFSMKATR